MPGTLPQYAFGPFELDPAERLLLRDGRPVALPPKAFDVLAVLVAHAGHLVTKDELLEKAWPGVVVAENVLSVTVSRLRAAMGEEGRAYVKAVPGHGYRFVVPVAERAALSSEPIRDGVGDALGDGPSLEDVVPMLTHSGDGVAPPAMPVAPAPAPAEAPTQRLRIGRSAKLAGIGAMAVLALVVLVARERPASAPAVSVASTDEPPAEALLAYRRGRALWESRRGEQMSEALGEFKLAATLDSTFAPAYVAQAQVYATVYGSGPEAEAALDHAFALDSTLAEAHATRGFIRAFQHWDWAGAEAAFARARALDPDDVVTLQWLASLRMVQRRLPESEAVLRRAIALRPDYASLHADLCEALYYRRAYADALAACGRASALDPEHAFAWRHRLWILAATPAPRTEAARAFLGDLRHWRLHSQGFHVDSALVVGGEVEGLLRGFLAYLRRDPNPRFVDAFTVARLYAGLRERDAALTHVEQAVAQRNFMAPFLNADPLFDPYRDDPRWIAAVRRMGLGS